MNEELKPDEYHISYLNNVDCILDDNGRIIMPEHIVKHLEFQKMKSFTLYPYFNDDNKLMGFTSILSKTAINPPQG